MDCPQSSVNVFLKLSHVLFPTDLQQVKVRGE